MKFFLPKTEINFRHIRPRPRIEPEIFACSTSDFYRKLYLCDFAWVDLLFSRENG